MIKNKCLDCNNEWIPRIETMPKACPRCKSYYWAVPKELRKRKIKSVSLTLVSKQNREVKNE